MRWKIFYWHLPRSTANTKVLDLDKFFENIFFENLAKCFCDDFKTECEDIFSIGLLFSQTPIAKFDYVRKIFLVPGTPEALLQHIPGFVSF